MHQPQPHPPAPSTRRPARPVRRAGLALLVLGSILCGAAAAAGTAAATTTSPSASPPVGSTRLTRVPIPAVPAGQRAGVSSSGDPIAAATTRVGIPFDVAGVTFSGPAPAGTRVEVRTRTSQGWGPWLPLELDSDDGPDPGSSEARRQRAGSAPLTAAGSDGVDVRISSRDGSVPPDLAVTVVDSPAAPSDLQAATGAESATASVGAPAIVPRSAWGADESLMPCQPDRLAGFQAAVVHHTVNANDYTSAQAPALMRGIFAFHTQTRGWCDIGYNFLVDRFGRIYEGRKGSISGFTMGAQAGGFNQQTFGVSVIGDFTTSAFPSAVRAALARVIAWQADRNAFNPSQSVTLTSAGSTRYDPGVRVSTPRVMGHRDLALTSCPGDAAYPQVPGIRSSAASQWAAGDYVGRAGKYTPVTARRFLDTRSGLGAPRTPLGPGGAVTIRPSGLPSDVTAVTVNLTTTATTANTSVAAYPAGQTPRSSSVLSTGAGRTTATAVTVGVGAGGAVTLRNSFGSTHLIADLAGYYSTGSTAGLVGGFRRVLDTRSGLGAPAQQVTPAHPLTLAIGNLPAGTRAVNLNLTATRMRGEGFLTAYAGGAGRPSTSNLNYAGGGTVANLAAVPLGPGGTVTIYASAPTDVVADLAGLFVTGSGSRFTPVSPRRVLDTRYGWGAAYAPLTASRPVAVPMAGVPSGATGVAFSLTATNASQPTAVTAYPTGFPRPDTSYVNPVPRQVVSGLVVSGIKSSSVALASTGGSVDVIGDLLGYYGG